MLDWYARIRVTRHAIVRSRERLGWGDEESIRAHVRDGILSDRVSGSRPNWVRSSGADDDTQTGGAEFVWDAEATHCWVVAAMAGGKVILVKTLIEGYQEATVRAEGRKIRTGMRRAS